MIVTRKKEVEIADAIGNQVYTDCKNQGFSESHARLWARIFRKAFLPCSNVYRKLRLARS